MLRLIPLIAIVSSYTLRAQEPLVVPFSAEVAKAAQEAWAKKLNLPGVEITNSVGMRFRVIPPGKFRMGNILEGPGKTDEMREAIPVVSVVFTRPWLIGSTEVTQSQWQSIMKSAPWKDDEDVGFAVIEGSDIPATYVSHRDALAFVAKLNEIERTTKYRLPTEMEWEYSCRAGTETLWSFGNDDKVIHDYGWFSEDGFGPSSRMQKLIRTKSPQEVAKKKPNPFGLFDLHGNVSEWCSDRYEKNLKGPLIDPMPRRGSDTDPMVHRGGAFLVPAELAFSALPNALLPTEKEFSVGFRVVCDIEEPK